MKTQTKKLKEICEIAKGKKVKIINEKTKNSVPYLLINTLRGKEPEFFTEDEKYTKAQKGDILMVFDGANSGLVGTGLKGAVGSTIGRIRLSKNVLNKYITYFLQSNFSFLNKDLKGSAIPHVKPSKMLELDIRLPEKKEQKQIVSAIETQFTRLDKAIKSLKAVKQKIKIYRKAVLKKAFEKAEGWEEKSFDKSFKSVSPTNKIQKRNYLEKGNLPVVDQGKKLIAGYINDISQKQKGEKPFIIFGDHTRRFKFVNFDFVTGADGIKILETNKFLEPKFAYYQCLTLDFPNKGYSRHFQYVKKSNLVFPSSLPAQSQIVSQIELKFSVIEKVEQIVNQSLLKTEMLKKSILKSAFEGKLVK